MLLFASLLAFGCNDGDAASGSDAGADAANATKEDAAADNESVVRECFGEPLPSRATASLVRPLPPAALEPYVPTAGFRHVDPEAAGMSAAGVEAALSFTVAGAVTEGLLIVRHGYIVGERYFGSFTEGATHESYSMAKSVTSALIGIAIEEKLLSGREERICKYYEQWSCDDPSDRHGKITVDHALNIRTGIQWAEDWRRLGAPNDAFGNDILSLALLRPVVDEPGTHLRYSTGDPALLTAVIQKTTGRTVLQYANEKIFAPLGIEGVSWASDASGRTTAFSGLKLTVRDYAKLGLLFLQGGAWDGEQLVPAHWVHETTQPDDRCAEQYRDLWHINPPMRLGKPDPACPEILGCKPLSVANLPGDIFFAEGAFGQAIYIIPSQDIVAVRVANDPLNSELWDEVSRVFLTLVLDAVAP